MACRSALMRLSWRLFSSFEVVAGELSANAAAITAPRCRLADGHALAHDQQVASLMLQCTSSTH
jgi:hypothetical protein